MCCEFDGTDLKAEDFYPFLVYTIAMCIRITAMLVAGLLLGACSRQVELVDNPLTIDAGEYNRVFHAGIGVLRDYGFELERQDYRFGVINTSAATSPTMFEPWCDHNSTPDQTWQSTLNHIQRRVTIFIEPENQSEQTFENDDSDEDVLEDVQSSSQTFLLRVEVLVERQEVPTRRMNGSAAGTGFSNLKAVPHELSSRGIAAQYWQTVGRDPYLENRILADIVRQSFEK